MEFVANVIMTSFSHRSDSWNRNATLTQDKMQGEQEQEKDSRVAKPNKTKWPFSAKAVSKSKFTLKIYLAFKTALNLNMSEQAFVNVM